MKMNQAVIVTDETHAKFDKGGIVLFVIDAPKLTDWQPDCVVGFADKTMYLMNFDQLKEA